MTSALRVLVLHASPRKGRNTDLMLEAFLGAVEKNDAVTCDHIYIYQLNILPCISCFSCKSEGICSIPDDMQECYQKISDADIIVIASPVYFNSVPAGLKLFIDRCQPFYYKTYLLQDVVKEKKGYLLACCDEGKSDPFIGVEKTVEALFYCLNTKMKAHYYCVLNKKHFNELVKEMDTVGKLGQSLADDLTQ